MMSVVSKRRSGRWEKIVEDPKKIGKRGLKMKMVEKIEGRKLKMKSVTEKKIRG
jgi:hypothetical protein